MQRRRGTSRGKAASVLGLVSLLGFVAIYLSFLPPVLGIKDEIGFVNQALIWKDPGLARRLAERPAEDFIDVGGRLVSWRNPGRSLVLLPIVGFHRPELYALTGLCFHLLTVWLAARMLLRRGRSPLWAGLVLFHPTLALYSRTVMADGPAATFILLGMLAWERPRAGPLFAGLSFGVAAGFRYHVGILVPALAIQTALAARGPERWRRTGAFLAGGGIVGLGLVLYNLTVYERPFGFTGQGTWSLSFIPHNVRVYFTALAVFWPLMVLTPLLHRARGRGALWTAALTLFGTMLVYSWHDEGAGALQTSVLGLRLLQPVLPLWIVAYAETLGDRLSAVRSAPLSRRACWAGGLLVGATFLGGQAALFGQHQQHLLRLREVREAISAQVPPGSLLVANATVRKLFASLEATQPDYRWRAYEVEGRTRDWSAELAAEVAPWYLAIQPKRPGYELPGELERYRSGYRLRRIETGVAGLLLYRADP